MNRKIWKNLCRASNGVCQRLLISSYTRISSLNWYSLVHLTTGDLCVWGAGHLGIKRLVKTTNSVWLKSYKITFDENRVLFLNTFKATDAWILTEECLQSSIKSYWYNPRMLKLEYEPTFQLRCQPVKTV